MAVVRADGGEGTARMMSEARRKLGFFSALQVVKVRAGAGVSLKQESMVRGLRSTRKGSSLIRSRRRLRVSSSKDAKAETLRSDARRRDLTCLMACQHGGMGRGDGTRDFIKRSRERRCDGRARVNRCGYNHRCDVSV